MGDRGFGLDHDSLMRLAVDIKQVQSLGIEICIVVGAGNLFRGLTGSPAGY